MNKKIIYIIFCLMIAACGKSANNETPQQRAAAACEAEAKTRIGEKSYQLDIAALAASAKAADGSWELQVPIVIEPGLRTEAKQILECTVRLQDGKPSEVTYINFNY
jgi:hypothetical protein